MNSDLAPAPQASSEPWLEVTCSRHFTGWMAEQRVSLACTTYQTGKLLLFGRKPDGELAVFERTFNRCMGLWSNGQTIWMNSLYQLWRLENILRPGEVHQGHDRLYVPKVGYTTGDLDIHDIVVDPPLTPAPLPVADKGKTDGRVVFVATGFNCLATINDRQSFTPLWRPSFISRMAAEDRCHLNGLTLVPGPRGLSAPWYYSTAVSTTDIVDGWRDRRRDGGVVLEVPTSREVAGGLSMPHSPRWYKDELWILHSGTGYIGKIDLKTGKFEPLTFCAGYLRGLAFSGNYAVVGLSRPRHDKTFGGLALDDELAKRGAESRCGLQVIDLRTGDVVHWVRLEGMVTELYDVVTLPGVERPMSFGFKTDEIQRTVSIGDPETL